MKLIAATMVVTAFALSAGTLWLMDLLSNGAMLDVILSGLSLRP